MFDVNQPTTLEALTKWWQEFKDRAPVPDEDISRFCSVFVGNKIDIPDPSNIPISPANQRVRVTEPQAAEFIDHLIPPPPPRPLHAHFDETPSSTPLVPDGTDITFSILSPSPKSHSIDINIYHRHPRRKTSRSRSRSRSTLFHSGTVGTMTTTPSLSVYHTPTSSIFDSFESARSSPVPRSSRSSHSNLSSPTSSPSQSRSPVRSIRRQPSLSSMISDAQTITPSLFVQQHRSAEVETTCTTPSPARTTPIPSALEEGTKLFFTSARTGEGVADVFEYIARRVVSRWKYEEAIEARTLHMAEASIDGAIRLKTDSQGWNTSACCSS